VGILLGKKFKENVEFFSQDNSGRILRSTLKINDSTFYISNIYAPNNGKERKLFFNAINDTLFKYTDDSDKNCSLILGDFNCAIPKNLDRNPPQQLDDISVREFQSMLHRNDLFDVWRKLNPETKIYTFKRGKSKSRIDYILCSNAHRHSNSGPPFFLIWSLPRLWYGSLSGNISLNHLSIFYNISCYNSLVLLTFVSMSSCRITYAYSTRILDPHFSSFGPSRDYGMDLCMEVYL
jgi:hypothetical protein